MKLLIMGLPGSGKTVQARRLSEDLGYCFVKTGEILRILAKQENNLGKTLKEDLDKGELVDDQVVGEIVRKEITKEECQKGIVVDGYPRSAKQLGVFNPGYDKVFYLDVLKKVLKNRLLKRGRPDDTEHVIDTRFKIQSKSLGELLEHFEKEGILAKVDGEKSIREVHLQIMEHLR